MSLSARKVTASVLALLTAIHMANPSLAQQPPNETSTPVEEHSQLVDEQTKQLNPLLIEEADDFVTLEGGRFHLSDTAKTALTQSEYEVVMQRIQESNALIHRAEETPGVIISTQSDGITMTDSALIHSTSARSAYSPANYKAKFREGVTKAKIYWWGVRVWLSRTTLRTMGEITMVSSVFIPHRIAAGVLAVLGYGISKAPGGVRFDTNPLLTPNPLAYLPTWNHRWQ